MKPRTRDNAAGHMQQMTSKLEEADEKMIVDRYLEAEGKYGHLNGKAIDKIDQVKIRGNQVAFSQLGGRYRAGWISLQ